MTAVGTAPCPWCAAPVERRKVGKHLKVYCNAACKNHFNNAMARLANLITRGAQVPGFLRELSDKLSDPARSSLTTRERATSPSEVVD